MPAFTGIARKQLLNEIVDLTGADPAHGQYGTQLYGNPSTTQFIVPLSLFFTKHPSMYLPLAAVAGTQEIQIEIHLRPLETLLQYVHTLDTAYTASQTDYDEFVIESKPKGVTATNGKSPAAISIESMQPYCQYVHLTEPEKQAIAAKPRHSRLFKQIQSMLNESVTMPAGSGYVTKTDVKFDLSFLHPVQTLFLVLRDPDDISENSYFKYHGQPGDDIWITGWDLVLNGQSRMTDKMTHTYQTQRLAVQSFGAPHRSQGSTEFRKTLMINFALNPTALNPSGHINFSNVATQQLKLDFKGLAGKTYRLDIYAVGLNWIEFVNGSAMVAFN